MDGALFEEKKHFLLHDFNSVVENVGGFMGLFLGFSLLNIYSELEKLLRRLTSYRIMISKRRGNEINENTLATSFTHPID